MKLFTKPLNRWGWLRIAGLALVFGVMLWVLLAAALRALADIPGLAWTGYQTFHLINGLELAAAPLLMVAFGAWMEDQDHKIESEQRHLRQAEQAVIARRKEAVGRVCSEILALLHESAQDASVYPRLAELTRAALVGLDGKGKGELLHFLFEKGLLDENKRCLDLSGADFSGLVFPKAHLQGLCLPGANLGGAQLSGANLAKAHLLGADLSKAFLRHADLKGARLSGSRLSGARLENASLEAADLRGANLEGALLNHANLKNAAVDRLADALVARSENPTHLDLAVLVETILPDGRKFTNAKGKLYLQKKEIETLVDRL